MTTLDYAAPERSLEQRMAALAAANEIRFARARLKGRIRAGEIFLDELLAAPPDCLATANVLDLLRQVPAIGPVKAKRILNGCAISSHRTVAGLSDRQRVELARLLEDRRKPQAES